MRHSVKATKSRRPREGGGTLKILLGIYYLYMEDDGDDIPEPTHIQDIDYAEYEEPEKITSADIVFHFKSTMKQLIFILDTEEEILYN